MNCKMNCKINCKICYRLLLGDEIVTSVTIFQIENSLLLFDEGQINLQSVFEAIQEIELGTNENGVVTNRGFTNPILRPMGDVQYIDVFGFEEASYGVYKESSVIDNRIETNENTFTYFTSCRVLIFPNNYLVIISKDSSEERVKVGVRKLLEEIGLSLNIVKMSPEYLRRVKNDEHLRFVQCTLRNVNNPNDSTRNISYDVDPADIRNQSRANEIYENTGDIAKLQTLFPYQLEAGNVNIVLTLYRNGNRCSFDLAQLNGGSLNTFLFVLANYLRGI